MDLGAQMARARAKRKMTQPQLAKELGVAQATVSMLETGELEPADELLERVKRWLASGKGPKSAAPRGPYKKVRRTIPG